MIDNKGNKVMKYQFFAISEINNQIMLRNLSLSLFLILVTSAYSFVPKLALKSTSTRISHGQLAEQLSQSAKLRINTARYGLFDGMKEAFR